MRKPEGFEWKRSVLQVLFLVNKDLVALNPAKSYHFTMSR